MNILLTTFCLSLISFASVANISGIAIQAEKNSPMQVYVNGKLYNKQPDRFVRIKSHPGLFHIEVKIFDPRDKNWYTAKKDIRVDKGMEFYYKVELVKGKPPVLREVRRYPIYSPYFLRPELYNRHAVS